MKKEQFEVITEALTWLHGEKLHKPMRAGSIGDFGFGDLVEKALVKKRLTDWLKIFDGGNLNGKV